MDCDRREDRQMKIIVAGGTGFIGHALVEELARQGHEVVVWPAGLRPFLC